VGGSKARGERVGQLDIPHERLFGAGSEGAAERGSLSSTRGEDSVDRLRCPKNIATQRPIDWNGLVGTKRESGGLISSTIQNLRREGCVVEKMVDGWHCLEN
jgi:hypothetical protein